jgi:hypothetical protein
MSIYVVYVLLLFASSALSLERKYFLQFKAFLFIALFLLSFFMAGFRYFTGTDYHNYYKIFLTHKPQEIGYNIFSSLFNSFFIFLVFFSLTSLIIKISFFKKTKNALLIFSLYLLNYFLSFDMGAIRNGFAIGIVFWAIYALLSNHSILFFLLVGLASCFHTTAVVFFSVFFFVKIKIFKNTTFLFFLLLLCIFFGYSGFIVKIISNIVSKVTNVESLLFQKLLFYSSLDRDKFSPSFVTNFIMIAFFTYEKNKISQRYRKNYDDFYALMMFGYAISYLFVLIPDIAIRLPAFFDVFKYVLLIMILKNNMRSYFVLLCFVAMGIAKYFNHIFHWYDYFIPFKSLF